MKYVYILKSEIDPEKFYACFQSNQFRCAPVSRRSRDQVVSECQSPIIVITGEDDVAPGLEASAKLAASAKRGSLHVIPSCGHYVPLEKPDALSAILSDVIKAQA